MICSPFPTPCLGLGHALWFVTFCTHSYIQGEVGLRNVLKQANITVSSHTFKTGEDPTKTVDDLFVSLLLILMFYTACYKA